MITQTLLGKITPTDVRIYIENGTPFLDYIGTAESTFGKVKVHLPKIGLDISTISKEEEMFDIRDGLGRKILPVRTKLEIFATNDKWIEYEFLEREVSIEQLEKELGYKIKIK